MTELIKSYPIPENLEALMVPKVNPTIWDSITPRARSNDLKFQKVQKPLIKGITALAKLVDGNESSEIAQDTIGLLANANFELLALRKEMLKPEINAKYTHLCKPSIKPTEYLFGDLSTTVKKLDEERKATAGLFNFKSYQPKTRSNNYRYQPYNRNGKPFLGQTRRHKWSTNNYNQTKFYQGKKDLKQQPKRLSGRNSTTKE
ncbi:uncharacterized protein [Antedon mediterranea]|uniref:uncharacterized protein n=1 Tax=Antedon mediterranea TaxID=105859 RepID=UPI003AF7103D